MPCGDYCCTVVLVVSFELFDVRTHVQLRFAAAVVLVDSTTGDILAIEPSWNCV